MTPEKRRETIVQAALPLVAELGAAVTTAKIARAAGIGEATIFRVFDDKTAVLRACVAAALNPAQALDELRSIPLDQPLAARLTDAVYALDAYLTRMGAVIGALHVAGTMERPDPATLKKGVTRRDESAEAFRQAIRDLFEPDRDDLRLPIEKLADLFLGVAFGRGQGRGPRETEFEVTVEERVDLFLHGALATDATR